MNYVLAIYDNEVEYANQLMNYMKRKQKQSIQTSVFTNQESLKEYLKHDKVHVLLINENIELESELHEKIKNICILSEGNYIRENATYPVIYKFQSAELVMQEIFSYFPIEIPESSFHGLEKSKLKIISIYSVTRDMEKTAFALNLAKQYAKEHNTLYINLDIFQTINNMNLQGEEKGLSDFIYYLKQNSPNLITKMNKLIMKEGNLKFIQGAVFTPDIYELTTEDMLLWIQEINNSTNYEKVIFNVGCFFQATLELFRNSSELLYIIGDKVIDKSKYEVFKNQLQWAGFDDVISKIKEITISFDKEYNLLPGVEDRQYSEVIEELILSYLHDDKVNIG